MKIGKLVLVITGLVLLAVAGCGSDRTDVYSIEIDPENFVSGIDNPYFTLVPGTVFMFEGLNEDDELERIEIVVTSETRVVMGVTCMVLRDTVYEGGEMVEDTFDWFAQDSQGNVWYFGEDSTEYEDGEAVSTAGSWEAGIDGALPGIIMEAYPQVGVVYRQEYYEGEAEDMAEIVELGRSVSTPLGDFDGCLVVKEWNPFETGVAEHKVHCPAVGYVVLEETVEGGSARIELISVETP